jgi:nitrate reductase gamma subunit
MSAANFVGALLPYFTGVVFLMGIVYRVDKWNKANGAKIPLFPVATNRAEKWKQILKEVLIFRSLFDGNRPLWAGAWVFHVALVLILLGHIRVVTNFPLLWSWLGLNNAQIDGISAVVGGAAGLLLLAIGTYLLFRRFVVLRVREISNIEDYVCLVLILTIVATGDLLRLGTDFDLNQAREYFAGLFSFRAVAAPTNPYFVLHFFLGQVFIMYIPFSKFLHIPGVFYSKSLLYDQ